MDRRKAIKIAAGALAAGTASVAALTTAFKPKEIPAPSPEKIELEKTESSWKYSPLDPASTSQLAYQDYNVGSCMYGVFSSIIAQLANKIGEPYTSFPVHMMKYGHGGIGGAGTICGTLNGAAAVMGLLIDNKKVRDVLTSELFYWYENNAFPLFKPNEPVLDFTPPTSVSTSVLCHASTTRWGEKTGFRIDSKQRKERCRRLTADVASRTVEILNSYFNDTYITNQYDNKTVNNCMTCHGSHGKLGNTTGKMSCTSCHDKSVGHELFGDIHYKLMD
ncbi:MULTISPECIES: cytochrome c3 family protein [unclassified Saccharicrinis]|uniref:cytochrome c3 family protein n=1 Tax=unclassified Saccharicrinis TaxID=2646859 RepID=UPI003D338E81